MNGSGLYNTPSDLHVHTNLSFCAPRQTLASSYLPHCGQEGVTTLGFSNHIYAPRYLKRAGIPEERGGDYALRLRRELEELQPSAPVRLLLGCEVETFCGEEPTLSPQEAKNFDYVLLAASHIMNFPDEYRNYDLSTPAKLRALILERFLRACELEYPVPTGICHPLYPICSPWEQEVVDGITDSQLADCFTLAAAKNKSIEIHACLYRRGTALDEEGLSPSYLRVLAAAKACGCRFHFGSDAHSPDAFQGVHRLLLLAAQRLGITREDIWPIARG